MSVPVYEVLRLGIFEVNDVNDALRPFDGYTKGSSFFNYDIFERL